MPSVQLIIDAMPPITLALVDEALAGCPEVCVVARDVGADALAMTIARLSPDVVLIGNPAALASGASPAELLGAPGLPRRIITLFDGSRGGRLVEWRVCERRVEPLSRASLTRALASTEAADG